MVDTVCQRVGVVLTSAFVCLSLAGAAAGADLTLRKGDHVVYIGNVLAERMQHDGELESRLHARFPGHDLVVRNLAFTADEVATRPRSQNFGSADEWLRFTKADVILAFFGYNESFAGEAGLPKFRKQLGDFIDHTLQQDYSGNGPPRLVLVSPIAHENLNNRHLPDGRENNARLALYTKAMAEVAGEKSVPFVDVFNPTLALYDKTAEPMTFNGIHLNPLGNRLVGRAIDEALFGPHPQKDEAPLERVRQAVIDKNSYWFGRYRALDGYNIYGGRSRLNWHGQSNADVMGREMEIFDALTANRDKRVWAVARGGDLRVDDSNVPPYLEVKTNRPGPNPDGTYPFLSGEEGIARMKLPEDLQVNLFADEARLPEVVNPVQMSVDTDGRLWVATWPSYPHWKPLDVRRDKLIILPDDDRDGRADRVIVFADNLNSVTGFEFWGGGVLVAMAPHLWFFKDTDGDDRVDVKVPVLHGLCSEDTHHTANSMVLGPDGGVYYSRGVFHVTNMETPTKTFRSTSSGVYRFDPRSFEIDFHYPIGPNPHGHVFDRFGYEFATDGTGGEGDYVSIGKGIVSHRRWYKKRVRPVPNTGILSSSHFPEKYRDSFLICNVIGFQGVLRHDVRYDGAMISAIETEPLLQSSDPNFRPSFVEVGADGSLLVADWHNPLIGHMQHSIRDPNRDKLHGRIYRITARGRPLLEPFRMKGKPVERVLDYFHAFENDTRYRARIELSGRDTDEVVSKLAAWTARLDANNPAHEQPLLEALWVYQEHRVPNVALLKAVLRAKEPRVRAAAVRTLGQWGTEVDGGAAMVLEAARDAEPLVRAQAVVAAVSFPDAPQAMEAYFEAALRPTDPELSFVLDYARREMNVEKTLAQRIKQGAALSDAAQRYAIGKANLGTLLSMRRTPVVNRAILARAGVPEKDRRAALAELAMQNNTTVVVELLNAIERHAAQQDSGTDDLLAMLRASDAKALSLSPLANRVPAMAKVDGAARIRPTLYAAWIAADGSADRAWAHASDDADTLRDLLHAVPMVRRAEALASLYPSVKPLLSQVPASINASKPQRDAITRAAVVALGHLPGHDAERFGDLAAIIPTGAHRDEAVASMLRIDEQSWPQDAARPLAKRMPELVGRLPLKDRQGPAYERVRSLAQRLTKRLSDSEAAAVLEQLAALDPQVVRIRTLPEMMRYDRAVFAVLAGRPVRVLLENQDKMPHNLLVLAPGSAEVVGPMAEKMGAEGYAKHFRPQSDRVLHATPLVNTDETAELNFTAPAELGEYDYICTFPGHWQLMRGVMKVVASADEASVINEGAQVTLRQWTLDDFAAELQRPHHGSFAAGKAAFEKLGCVQCHVIAGREGGLMGPDLTEAFKRWKNDRRELLTQIIEPSKVVEDRYRSHTVELPDGDVLYGFITERRRNHAVIVTNPQNPRPQRINTRGATITAAENSPMPQGLINLLDKPDVLDLLLYLETGGNAEHPAYRHAP